MRKETAIHELWNTKFDAASYYGPVINYKDNTIVVYDHCHGLNLKQQALSMHCRNGKVKLHLISEPLENLMFGVTP